MDAAGWSGGDDVVVGLVDRATADADREPSAAISGADASVDAIEGVLQSVRDARGSSGDRDETDGIDGSTGSNGTGGAVADKTANTADTADTADTTLTVERGPVDDVLDSDPSLLITHGEAALSAVARARPTVTDVPVLPVGALSGIESIEIDRLADAMARVLAGDARKREHTVLRIDIEDAGLDSDSDPGTGDRTEDVPALDRVLFDVTLVTDEPARISEYGVRASEGPVATFRADGVVVATPAGSHGYASAVDAPQLSPALDAVAVAPIAPFVTRTRRWVLPGDGVTLTVERDEDDVTVVADERAVATVSLGAEVTVSADGTLSTLSVPDDVR